METRGFQLAAWQSEAVTRWERGDSDGPFRGTLEVFTGGGKTLIALACAVRAAQKEPSPKLAIVVPTEALARQWIDMVARFTTVNRADIGLLGAGGQDSLQTHRVLVCVLNTAAQRLPEMSHAVPALMLIVDECHRAGAPIFSKVLDTVARFRLGLSATPDREETDEAGEPLDFDEQILGQALGRIVYRFTLGDARAAGWLPDYEIHHHGVTLFGEERSTYLDLSRQVDEVVEELSRLGIDPISARRMQQRRDDVGQLAAAYLRATSRRKDLLYRAAERTRIAVILVRRALARNTPPRILLFHERVAEADELFARLQASVPNLAIEHSLLPDAERIKAMQGFRSGQINVLVSVKSLIEGIDVPDADIGISVASSSSVRQRIQSLGRVLRRRFADIGQPKRAEMHVIYVADTVDETIYSKENWSDLTGPDANRYWRWPAAPDENPLAQQGPPRTPRPTEAEEWERLEDRVPEIPVPWLGAVPAAQYSIDTRGTVITSQGALIKNPQNIEELLRRVRQRPGGAFWVTPLHRLVLVRADGGGDHPMMIAGQLVEAFGIRPPVDETAAEAVFDVHALTPGMPYPGPMTRGNGEFQLRQKSGGVIERTAAGRIKEFAQREGSGQPQLEENARRVLAAWHRVSSQGMRFFINEHWHAWYLEKGQPHFLADVPGGFVWPTQDGS